MKPHIQREKGVWIVYAIANSYASAEVLLAYLFAVRLNGNTHYTPVKFV